MVINNEWNLDPQIAQIAINIMRNTEPSPIGKGRSKRWILEDKVIKQYPSSSYYAIKEVAIASRLRRRGILVPTFLGYHEEIKPDIRAFSVMERIHFSSNSVYSNQDKLKEYGEILSKIKKEGFSPYDEEARLTTNNQIIILDFEEWKIPEDLRREISEHILHS